MNLRQLQFAASVAETGSFSAAARACHVTQPALSNGIAQLEAAFGGKLFQRTTRRVDLTAFGRLMLPKVAAVLTAEAELRAGVRSYFQPEHQLVRIGLSPIVDSPRIAAILEPFFRRNPTIQRFFKECFLDDLRDRLAAEQLDILIRPSAPDADPGIVRIPLYAEPICVLGAGGASGAAIGIEELDRQTVVLGPDGCGLGGQIRSLFDVAGKRLTEYPGQALSYQVMQDWAMIGIGATLLPLSKIAEAHRPTARPLLDPAGDPVTVQIEAWWTGTAAVLPHLSDLRNYLSEVVPSLVAGAAA